MILGSSPRATDEARHDLSREALGLSQDLFQNEFITPTSWSSEGGSVMPGTAQADPQPRALLAGSDALYGTGEGREGNGCFHRVFHLILGGSSMG